MSTKDELKIAGMTLENDGDTLVFLSTVILLLAFVVFAVYVGACIALYAYVQLTGALVFTWTNSFWVMILMFIALFMLPGSNR